MFAQVFTGSFALVMERWRQMGAVALVALAILIIPSAVLFAAVSTKIKGEVQRQAAAAQTSTLAASTTPMPPNGSPSVEPSLSPGTIGGILGLVVAFMILITIAGSIVYIGGTAAALGADIRDAVMTGVRGFPHLTTQLTITHWLPTVLFFASFAANAVSVPLGVVLMLVMLGVALWQYPRFLAVVGSVAAGSRSWRPTEALDLVAGTRTIGGVLAVIAVSFCTSLVVVVPVIGVFLSQLTFMVMCASFAAFYLAVGGSEFNSGPRRAVSSNPQPGGAAAQVSPPLAFATGGHAAVAHAPVQRVPVAVAAPIAAVVAIAAAPPTPVAAAATPQMIQGPTHDGPLDAGASWGEWIQPTAACTIAVQVAWGGPSAPILHVMDPQGAARQPALRIPTNGAATWIDVPAGNSYIAVQLDETAAQNVRAAIWVPAAEAAQRAA